MTATQYQNVINYFNVKKSRKIFLIVISKVLPILNAIMYLSALGYLYISNNQKLYKAVIIPLIVFVFVTVIRKILNYKRPYDELDFIPFFENVKKDKGKSFPSRHTASAFVIAMSLFYINMYVGIIGFITAVLIGISRILIGVHYPKDVIVAFFVSVIISIFGFYII